MVETVCAISIVEELQEGIRRGLAEIITDFPGTCSQALYKILTHADDVGASAGEWQAQQDILDYFTVRFHAVPLPAQFISARGGFDSKRRDDGASRRR
jgi:hypothetical protein